MPFAKQLITGEDIQDGSLEPEDFGDTLQVTTITADDAITLTLTSIFHVVTLTENCTITFPTPTVDGWIFEVHLIEDGDGTWEVTWPATVEWDGGSEPTQTTTATNKSIWSFSTTDGGTSWFGIRIADGVA